MALPIVPEMYQTVLALGIRDCILLKFSCTCIASFLQAIFSLFVKICNFLRERVQSKKQNSSYGHFSLFATILALFVFLSIRIHVIWHFFNIVNPCPNFCTWLYSQLIKIFWFFWTRWKTLLTETSLCYLRLWQQWVCVVAHETFMYCKSTFGITSAGSMISMIVVSCQMKDSISDLETYWRRDLCAQPWCCAAKHCHRTIRRNNVWCSYVLILYKEYVKLKHLKTCRRSWHWSCCWNRFKYYAVPSCVQWPSGQKETKFAGDTSAISCDTGPQLWRRAVSWLQISRVSSATKA